MVARYDINGNPRTGNQQQRFKGLFDDGGVNTAPEEQVAAVNDQVYVSGKGRLQGTLIVPEKIRAATSFLDSGI